MSTYSALFLLIVLNIICLVIKKKNRLVTIISIVIFSLLMGGNTQNNDFDAYSQNYSLVQSDESHFIFSYLFNPLMLIGGYLGMDYNQFLLILSIIFYSLLFIYLYKKNDYKIHAIILLYVFYSFFVDVVQIANFFSNVFAIIFLYKLHDYRISLKKKDYVISVILLVLSLGFHESNIILIPLLFWNIDSNIRINKYAQIALIVAFIDVLSNHVLTISILSRIPYFNSIFASFIGYARSTGSGFGFIKYYIILLLLLTFLRSTKLSQNCTHRDLDHVKNFLIYILVLSPVLSFSSISYTRIMRVITIYYSDIYSKIKFTGKNIGFWLFILLLFVYFFATEIDSDVFNDVMKYNRYLI